MGLRWIAGVMGALLAAGAAAQDLLILRDGTRRQGTISGCREDGCTLDGRKVPRSTIVWVGLGSAAGEAPAPRNPGHDEVHLVSGRVVSGEFGGMSLGAVLIGEESLDRDEVAWLRFAGPEPAPPPTPPPPAPIPGASRGGSQGSGGTPTATPGRPRPPSPPPSRPPIPPTASGGHPSGAGERGALWTGTIAGRDYGTVDGISSEISYTIDVKLREYRYPLQCPVVDARGVTTAPRVGTFVQLASEGSRLEMRFTATSAYGSGSGQGETTVTTPGGAEAGAGAIWTKTADVDLTGCLGADIPRGSSAYLVGINPPPTETYNVRWSNGSSWDLGFATSVLGHSATWPATPCSDSEIRFLQGSGGVMAGRFTVPCAGCCPTAEVAWSICREGVACPPVPGGAAPPAPSPSPPPSDCDETRADRAQLDALLDQWRLYAQQLKQATAAADAVQRAADQQKGDFEQAMRDCNLWGVAQLLASLLTSGLVEGQPQGFNAFANYVGQLEKIASGDPSWLLPSSNVEVRGQEWTSVETAYDAFNLGYQNLGQSSPQQLIDRLRGCGAPTLNEVLDGAYAYLHLMEQLKPLADRMHEAANTLNDQEEKIFDFCLRHPKACQDYDACRQGR